ncbi:MAG TPA: HipA domain-containing protein [Burkholderiaceae bacterium]
MTRFDRRWQGVAVGAETKARFKPPEGVWIARLPQQDFCQALGVAPDRKYQSDRGPSVQDCLTVLAARMRTRTERSSRWRSLRSG